MRSKLYKQQWQWAGTEPRSLLIQIFFSLWYFVDRDSLDRSLHDCKTVPAGQRQLKSQTRWQQSCLGRWEEQSLEVCSRWWTTWWKTGGSIESRSHFQLSQNQVPVSASQRSSSCLKWHDNTKGLYAIQGELRSPFVYLHFCSAQVRDFLRYWANL